MYVPNLRCDVVYKTVGALSFTDISSSTYYYYCAIPLHTPEFSDKRALLYQTSRPLYHTPRLKDYWKYTYVPNLRCDVMYKMVGTLLAFTWTIWSPLLETLFIPTYIQNLRRNAVWKTMGACIYWNIILHYYYCSISECHDRRSSYHTPCLSGYWNDM